jgi:hypothetical protein
MAGQVSISSDYIAGFVDGEGCFALKYRADRKYKEGKLLKEYFYWTAEFAIVLHITDTELLKTIQSVLGVGHISFAKVGDQVRYSVQNTSHLHNVIIPFFERFPLLGSKGKDFSLWAAAVRLLFQHQSMGKVGKSRPMDPVIENKLKELKKKVDAHKRKE